MTLKKAVHRKLIFVVFCCLLIGMVLSLGGCDLKQQADKPAVENSVKRVAFDQLFEVNGTTVKPRTIIRYGGTTFTPEVPFEVQVITVNNEPFAQLIGRDAEVKVERGVTEVIRFY